MNGMDVIQIQNFIDGQFESTWQYLDSYDPSRDVVWAQVPDSDYQDLDRAVSAAKRAFKR